ncbi:SsgA family sporulation/cell division regulator [Streptomyces erythrochromogenes]|uniref:SsgA family sporulation/cell division regulator n=1 Tax=Streptomyces erythrochromogenes TaxID=285574 RepID=UPI0036F9A2BA
MSADKDDTMHNTAEDAEFAALMAASSLGAPHVQNHTTGIDESARRQLKAAIAAPDDAALPLLPEEDLDVTAAEARLPGEETGPAATAEDGHTRTDGSDASMALHHRRLLLAVDIAGYGPRADPLSARRQLWELLARASQEWSGEPRPRDIMSPDRGDAVLLVAPPGSGKTSMALSLLLEARRGTLSSERLHRRYALHPVREAVQRWLLCVERDEQQRPPLDILSSLNHWAWMTGVGHQAPACPNEPQPRWLSALRKWSQEPGRPSELQTARCSMPDDDPALALDEPTSRSVVAAGMLLSERLTDLLHAPPPSPWSRLTLHCTQLDEPRGGLTCKPGRPGGGQRSLPGWNGFLRRQERSVVGLFDVHPKPRPDLTLSPETLLLASELAVDLDAARRLPIPAQAATPPNMDEYMVRPGSTLLVPRGEQAALGPEEAFSRPAPGPGEGEEPVEGTGELLWNKKDRTGDERQARMWMRVHLHEGDRGERLPVTLTYSQVDRHAITVVFHTGTDSDVRWTFARDLLVDGLHHSVGIGDVIVWPTTPAPATGSSDVPRVHIRLRSPEGTALLSVARPDIAAFLDTSEPLASAVVTETDNGYLKAWERELTELIGPRASE